MRITVYQRLYRKMTFCNAKQLAQLPDSPRSPDYSVLRSPVCDLMAPLYPPSQGHGERESMESLCNNTTQYVSTKLDARDPALPFLHLPSYHLGWNSFPIREAMHCPTESQQRGCTKVAGRNPSRDLGSSEHTAQVVVVGVGEHSKPNCP